MGSGPGNIYEASVAEGRPVSGGRTSANQRGNKPSKHASQGTIEGNIELIRDKFGIDKDGFIAERGSKPNRRVYRSDDPLADSRELYEKLGAGCEESRIPGGKGVRRETADKAWISYRETTGTPDSPAVEISRSKTPAIQNQRIHFVKKDKL